MRAYILIILMSTLTLIDLQSALALDSEDSSDIDQVEAEIGRNAPKQSVQDLEKKDDAKFEKFSDLGKLAPFSEISVIQKRYMPKTGRFQAYGGLNYLTNDPWYWGVGATLKLGYFFTEAYGIEGTYSAFSTSEKQPIKDLRDNHAVSTSSLTTTKSYMGLDFVWTPVYGKLSLGNQKIVPFDMYFAFGGGNSGTSDSQTAGTLHFGTGQIFAISKSMGFRWDFSWNRFSAAVRDETTGNSTTNSTDNLFLTLGVSFFFPEAKYR